MKKSLLLTAALAASCSAFAFTAPKALAPLIDSEYFSVAQDKAPALNHFATRASGSMDFTYAGDPATALSLNNTTAGVTRAYCMFGVEENDIKALKSNQVKGFTMYSPAGANQAPTQPLKNVTFFISTGGEPVYTQEVSISSTSWAENTFTLDTPYEITGNENYLFFGYYFTIPTTSCYYYVVDYMTNSNPMAGMIGASNTDAMPALSEFMSTTDSYGALCMSVRVEGDNLPENRAAISETEFPAYLPLTSTASYDVIVTNKAVNNLTSFEITTSVTGMPDVVQSFNVGQAVGFNESVKATVENIKGLEAGFSTITAKITKVNGVDFTDTGVSSQIACYDSGYDYNVVAEDATGTWCGWCPGGIEAMEYLKKKYGDRMFAIGVHNQDRMAIDEYQKFVNAYVSGFPSVFFNRAIQFTPTLPYAQVCQYIDQVYQYYTSMPSYAKVDLAAKVAEDKKTVKVTATDEFAVNTTVPHYLSFVAVQDGMGPYSQSNYFPGQGIAMNGWENKGGTVQWVFDDVARVYASYPGIPNSVPATIKAGEKNVFEYELDLTRVTSDDFRLIAMITNAETGQVINACQINVNKDNIGVEDINADSNIKVVGGQGVINVTGTDNYNVYTVSGMRVANRNLPAGMYIVVAGGKSIKVVVR